MIFISLLLMFIGLYYITKYSTIPWWIWLFLIFAIITSIFSNVVMAFNYFSIAPSVILSIVSFILFIISLILIILYSTSPWWVWLILGGAIIFSFLSSTFESISDRNSNAATELYSIVLPNQIMPTINI